MKSRQRKEAGEEEEEGNGSKIIFTSSHNTLFRNL
jgi:hypothetical protein